MNIEAFCQQLRSGLSCTSTEKRAEVLCREISLFYEIQEHEVALFQVNAVNRMAVLRAPQSMGNPATIPLQKIASSLIASTYREQRGFLNNDFANTPHLYMVERTLAEREQRVPVQKIMSVPIMLAGEVGWIIQVARKGKTCHETGPDFSDNDLRCLENMAAAAAGLL